MKIIILIPYFGKLPINFPAFLHSCKYNNFIHYHVITDDDSIKDMTCPPCVTFEISDINVPKDRIARILGDFQLPHPYKLCDYRPLYSQIFSKEIEGYDYWGYCDIDTLMGDVESFLRNNDFEQYDRVGKFGHFTIYRNDIDINTLYNKSTTQKSYGCKIDYVKGTTYPCHFDELGMNQLCKEFGIKFLENNFNAGIENYHSLHFHTFDNVFTEKQYPQFFTWEKGHIYSYKLKDNNIEKKEYMYIHFQDRKNMPIHEDLGDSFLITHKGFWRFDPLKTHDYFDTFGRNDTIIESREFEKKQQKNRRKGNLNRLKREFQNCGIIKAISNIYKYKKIYR